MKVVALTGGIASGKSTVARLLRELGAEVIDADQIAREVTAPGQPALAEVVAAFGEAYLLPDGGLDRRKLGELVFADPQARAKLNAIVHPRVRARLREARERIARERPDTVLVMDIPLLFESDVPDYEGMDAIVVYASPETQIARLMARDGLSRDQAQARLRAQIPLADKLPRARWVVHNDGPLADTRTQVARIWEEILAQR
ncbi:MAG: dephospho-CoA kinase [Armatimonadota bacterium]|nr:dephospho-CoA kinase [Armatimonadota bacterium]MDR5697400.1 dephospho-CoA kinase [Armatimonadota bacterium]